MVRVFFFLLGFGFMVIGCSFIILYLNLMSMGYNFLNYVNFPSSKDPNLPAGPDPITIFFIYTTS